LVANRLDAVGFHLLRFVFRFTHGCARIVLGLRYLTGSKAVSQF
jgi:hypothetical protein